MKTGLLAAFAAALLCSATCFAGEPNFGGVPSTTALTDKTGTPLDALTPGTAGVPSSQVLSVQGVTGGTPQQNTPSDFWPYGWTQTNCIATGTTGAVVCTIAAVANKTNYLCEADISATGGTASLGPIVIAGLQGGSRTYQFYSTASGANFTFPLGPVCVPASAPNTAITITSTADGTASAVDIQAVAGNK